MNLLYSTTAPLAVFAVSVFYLVSVIHIVSILVVVMVITIVSNLTMITTWPSQSPLTTIYPMCVAPTNMTGATQVLAYLYIYPMCVDLPEEEEQQPPAEPPPVVEKVPDDHDYDYCH